MDVIKSMCWNSHSVQNKISYLQKFVDSHNLKLIFLSETWLNNKSTIKLSHFKCYRADRNRGGVCILIHNSIPHSYLKHISLDYAEAIFLKIHSLSGDYTVCSLYCSPAATRAQAKHFFMKVMSTGGPIVIAGDFNAKHHAWNNTNFCYKGSDLFKLCSDKKFNIHSPDGPTVIPPNGKPSAIDFLISKALTGVVDPKVCNDLPSDHMPLLFAVPFTTKALINFKTFNFPKANWNKFRQILVESTTNLKKNFPNLNTPDNIESCIDAIITIVQGAMESSIPKKLPYKFKYPYSQEIHILTKARNSYRNKFLSTGDPFYKSAMNQLNNLIRQKTAIINQKSFDTKLSKLNTKDLSLYQFAKYLKNKKTQCPPLKSNSKLAYSNKEKADELASAFHGCHRTTVNMHSPKENIVKNSVSRVANISHQALGSKKILTSEIKMIIKELKMRKAPGEDNISNRVIKFFPSEFIEILTKVFNSCLSISHFPSQWKIGKIVAIPKPGKDHSIPTNYRPISLLSNIGKIFEKLILNRLNNIEEERKIFIPSQFGFRNDHSTIQQILRITQKAAWNFNLNRSTGMVMLDVEKAFDSVWHDGLVYKLLNLQFPTYLVKIIKSYLSNRKAFVTHSDSTSELFEIDAGVPQGSILAPFLFNVFINDIPNPKNCELAIYADDTALVCDSRLRDIKFLKNTLEKGLSKVQTFFSNWKIKLNDSKTEFIIFTKSPNLLKKRASFPPSFNSNIHKWQDTAKYLGVTLDAKLCFKQHIELSMKKANAAISTLFCLLRKNNSVSLRAKILMYKAYIRPILTYAGTIIINCPTTHFKRLQTLQNKCLRMVLSKPFYTRTTELHEQARIPTIRDFVLKNTDRFYLNTLTHDNQLVKPLGNYTIDSLPFRLKHRLPKAVC